jgi:outer membrane protein assembly factor BamE (lipoprotein component of BamABCDE complex)
MKRIATLICAIVLCGCASKPESVQVDGRPGHIKQGSTALLRVGMSKDEVLAKIGPPATVSADSDKEILFYTEEMPWWNWKQVRVVILNGKVSEYGQVQK